MPSRLILVRHGRTAWSVSGQHTGRTDIPLLDEGRADARRLGARLVRDPWRARLASAVVRTSPLSRASETADLAGFADRAAPWDALMEFDYGDYEGLTPAQIRERHPGWVIWRDGVPDGETLKQVSARADTVVDWARGPENADPDASAAEGRDVVVFAHGHILRVIAARWMGLDAAAALNLRLAPASLSVLDWSDDGVPAIALWNDTAHLEAHSETS
ncbi:histidine phosphatase family protein [Mangrovactinospora gilvigrisea]|uniref:Histidine phosphatase family protein n=1 Tax=Mangrovactinospora gilvigrisea TaxID=1428644 RepID=A0A1J7C3H6_9ACTN|nr:histidine phosphatase family protein [Mangrovactinospora gilvigrisea]OIV36096.1 histidine phosphatase family protein [Mangrovactinospora gilvigrisea]